MRSAPHPLTGLFAGRAHAEPRALLTHVCIAPGAPIADSDLTCLADPAEAAWLLKAAKRTTVAGMLWARLTPEQRAGLPGSLRDGLHELYLGYGLQAECARKLVSTCRERLNSAGIPVMALKGAALATLYGDPAERPMNDVDLLVPESDLPEAYRLLGGDTALLDTHHRHPPALVVTRGLPPVEVHGDRSHATEWPHCQPFDPFAPTPDRASPAPVSRLHCLDNWLHIACHGTSHTLGIWPRMAADLARLQAGPEWRDAYWEDIWNLARQHGQYRRALMAAAFANAGRLPEPLRATVASEPMAADAERRARQAWLGAWEPHGPDTVKWVKLWTLDPHRVPRELARQALPSPATTARALRVPVLVGALLTPAYGLYRLGALGASAVATRRLMCREAKGSRPTHDRARRRVPARACLPLLPHVAAVLWCLRRAHGASTPAQLVSAATPPGAACNWRLDSGYAAARLCRALVRRLPGLFPQPCLYYCLGGFHFLRRARAAVVLHVGMRQGSDALTSHAWLTVDGQPVFDDPLEQGYVEMISFGPSHNP